MNTDDDKKPLPLEYARSDAASHFGDDILLFCYGTPPTFFALFFGVAAVTNSYTAANVALLFGLLAIVVTVPASISIVRHCSGALIVTLIANAIAGLLTVPVVVKSWF